MAKAEKPQVTQELLPPNPFSDLIEIMPAIHISSSEPKDWWNLEEMGKNGRQFIIWLAWNDTLKVVEKADDVSPDGKRSLQLRPNKNYTIFVRFEFFPDGADTIQITPIFVNNSSNKDYQLRRLIGFFFLNLLNSLPKTSNH